MKQVTLDPKEEAQFEELNRLGQKLHVPIPQARWKLEVFLRGDLVQSYEARSHSWNRNAYNAMFYTMTASPLKDNTFEAGKLSAKLITGAIAWHATDAGYFDFAEADDLATPANYTNSGVIDIAAGHVSYKKGIWIGLGAGAEDFEGFDLVTPIVDGAGADEMNSASSEPHALSYVAGTKTLTDTLIRYFNNNSGNPIDINEVGLFQSRLYDHLNNATFLFTRDLLGATVTVPNTGQLKVTYTISLVYPS